MTESKQDMSASNSAGPMDGEPVCACGHVANEHGGDPKYPGSTACAVEGCDCIAFEEQEDAK
jgi:hypothetical protein